MERKENKKIKVLEYFGFKDEKEALEWYEEQRKRMIKTRKEFEDLIRDFDNLFESIFNRIF